MRENEFSVWHIGGGVGVFRLRSETELMLAPVGAEYLTIPLSLSIIVVYISIDYSYLEEQSRYTTSYPSNTFW